MRWRFLLTIVAIALITMAFLQFIWAAHMAALGGDNAAVGAANEANAVRTGVAGLVLLAVIALASSAPARRLTYWIWERLYQLW